MGDLWGNRGCTSLYHYARIVRRLARWAKPRSGGLVIRRKVEGRGDTFLDYQNLSSDYAASRSAYRLGKYWRSVGQWRSLPLSASTSAPSRAPAGLADIGSGHALAVPHRLARAASQTDLRDHVAQLKKRRRRHCLRRRCKGQGKASNSDQPHHLVLPESKRSGAPSDAILLASGRRRKPSESTEATTIILIGHGESDDGMVDCQCVPQ